MVQMMMATMMTAAMAANTHGVASVRVFSWGWDSPVPGLAGPLPAGFGVVGAPDDGAGVVGVVVGEPEGSVGDGVATVTLPWVAASAALAATAMENVDQAKRVKASVVTVSLRSTVVSWGRGVFVHSYIRKHTD
jgi:hypothetical protein